MILTERGVKKRPQNLVTGIHRAELDVDRALV
jgi:hypothetical protein